MSRASAAMVPTPRYLIRNTGVVSIGRIAGVLSGMGLDAAILAFFGLGNATDAFLAALTIPILIDGTLSIQVTQVLVPVLASTEKESGRGSGWTLLSNLVTVWLLVASGVSGIATAIAVYIIPLQVPGLASDTLHLAIRMNMLLVWLIPLSGLAAMLQGALLSQHKFLLISWAKAMSNVSIAGVFVLLFRTMGIYALACGYVAGFMIQCAVLWIALWRRGFHYRWSPSWRDPRLKDVARMVLYPLGGQLLGESRTLIENFLASFYVPGVLSAMRYAARIIYALSGVLMSSVVTATTPLVAHHAAAKDWAAMKSTLRDGMKLLVFMSVPICAWLTVAREPLISLLFERGQFARADVVLTSSLMALMSPYILFSRAISLAQAPFYAVKDTRTLVVGMMVTFGSYLVVAPLLLYALGVYGFPLATVVSTAAGTLGMCWLLRRSFGRMEWTRLRSFSIRTAGAWTVACVGLLLGREMSLHLQGAGLLERVLALGVQTLLGFGGFAVGILMFGAVRRSSLLSLFTDSARQT